MDNLGFTSLYKKLNTQQKKAVDTIDGPVLVLAGPGTGKTQVLTMRIANILRKTDTPPDAILGLTFTESGVQSMKERLRDIIGKTAYYTNIHTFHSFASDIIKSNPDEFTISTHLEPLSDLERIYIFKEIFDELHLNAIKPFNSPYFYLKTAISKIQDLKREAVDADEFAKLIEEANMDAKDRAKNRELLLVYQKYLRKLKEYGRYDFEDMINFVIDKFRTSKDLLARYQERFQYFLVDEFQDTNNAQAELLYLLNSYWQENPNLFVVGDDDQSIFRFQGASLENITTFLEKYPAAKKISLNINYRSDQLIIDASQSVISKNKFRISSKYNIDKTQKSNKKHNEHCKIRIAEFDSSYSENYFVATEIKNLIKKGVEPSEIAVIYRNNADSADISDMLSRFGITYKLEGGENVLETGLIIRLLHLLQVIEKIRLKAEDMDLFTLLNYEFLKINPLDVLKLSRFATEKKINLFDAILHKNIDKAGLKEKEKLIQFKDKLVFWNELSANTTLVEFIDQVINESGFLAWILDLEASYEYLNILNSFLSEVRRLNKSDKSLTLSGFLRYVELMKEHNISINEDTLGIETSNVLLSTAHKAKGREFKYVFIPKFIDKKWSNINARNLIKLPKSILKTTKEVADEKMREEEDDRRLFYVTLTRAKQQITITSAQNYYTAQNDKAAIASMFLYELPQNLIENVDTKAFEKDTGKILKQLLHPKLKDKNVSDDEKAFLRSTLRNFKISATALNTYIECPYKFKLNYLLKTPTPREKHLVLGTAVHSALENTYKDLISGRKITKQSLLGAFINALDDEILNESEYGEIKAEGEQILTTYFKVYEVELTSKPSNKLFLEKFLGWGWSKPLLGEIPLQGKIDKMEVINPTKKLVKVTDYKTGRPKSRNYILGKTKYSNGDLYRQLIFYKLLVDLDNSLDYRVSLVELDFVGNRNLKPKRESFEVQDEDLEDLKSIIKKVYENIMNLQFGRTKEYRNCVNCRYKHHCWPDGIPSSQMDLGIYPRP